MFLLELVDFKFLSTVYFYETSTNISNFEKPFHCTFYLRNKICKNGHIPPVILNIQNVNGIYPREKHKIRL